MIPTYSEYIRRYVRRASRAAPPSPGEHHFVAAYLVPKLYSINRMVPDYINPDGTKSILGDVVYYRDGKHHFGIECKLGTIRLTKREFNGWIDSSDSSAWPDLFVGVGRNGIALAAWGDFRVAYIGSIRAKLPDWMHAAIDRGYGPSKQIDELSPHLPRGTWFPFAANASEASQREAEFTDTLRRAVEAGTAALRPGLIQR